MWNWHQIGAKTTPKCQRTSLTEISIKFPHNFPHQGTQSSLEPHATTASFSSNLYPFHASCCFPRASGTSRRNEMPYASLIKSCMVALTNERASTPNRRCWLNRQNTL